MTGQTREHVVRCMTLARGDPNVAFELCQLSQQELNQVMQAQQQAMAGGGGMG